MHRRIAAIAGLVLCLALLAGGAGAQVPLPDGRGGEAAEAARGIDTSSPETIRAAVARLSDAEVRALLLERLDAVAAAEAGADRPASLAAGLAAVARQAAQGLAAASGAALSGLGDIPAGLAEALTRFAAARGALGILHLVAVGLLAVAAGLAAERLCRHLLGARDARRAQARPEGPGPTLRLVSLRLLLELLELAAFILAAWAAIALLHPPEPMSYLILWVFLKEPVLYARAAAAVARFLLAPETPATRLVEADDAGARRLHRDIVTAAFLVGLSGYVLDFLGGHGVDLGRIRIGFWLTLGVSGWIVFALWRARAVLTGIMQGGRREIAPVEDRLARAYPWLAMAVVAASWALHQVLVGLEQWHLLDGRVALSMVLLLAAPPADAVIRWAVASFGPRMSGEGAVAERAAAAARRAWVRIGRVLAVALLVIVIGEIWAVSLSDFAGAQLGAQVAGRLLGALGVVAVGYVAWEVAGLWVNRRLAAERAAQGLPEEDEPGGGEGGGPGGSRLSTVLPLVAWVMQAAIVVLTALVALGTLGIDTTPLLAGAGIVGLAIGFGAQRLVADIVSGLFFLIDDAFRIGEYVEIEGTFGTVERISLRSLILRHHEGPVHTLPFGEIRQLTNYSRDWVIMKLRFTVPFDTDLRKVKKLFKQIGREMAEAEQFAGDFLQPFKLQGVYEVDEVGIVIRGKFMARPGRQWVLRKEIYTRVQEAFEANGIQFARKEVRVKIEGGGETLDRGAVQAIGAAAAEAAETPPAPRPAPAGPGS